MPIEYPFGLGLGVKTAYTLQIWLEADHTFRYPRISHKDPLA